MKSPVPLQFLVGLTRLIAVYFALRALDSSVGVVISWVMQQSMDITGAAKIPSVWWSYPPIIAFYIGLSVIVWIEAPAICRFALNTPTPAEEEKAGEICWNGVMIFLVGTLFVGWGLARLGDELAQFLNTRSYNTQFTFSNAEVIRFLFSVILIGIGGIMMARFPALHRWMQKRAEESTAQ